MAGRKDKNPNRESGFVWPSKQICATGGNPFAVLQTAKDDDGAVGGGASAVVANAP